MTRKLLDGKEVEELEDPVELKIITRCPQKYKLIDMETGISRIYRKFTRRYKMGLERSRWKITN